MATFRSMPSALFFLLILTYSTFISAEEFIIRPKDGIPPLAVRDVEYRIADAAGGADRVHKYLAPFSETIRYWLAELPAWEFQPISDHEWAIPPEHKHNAFAN